MLQAVDRAEMRQAPTVPVVLADQQGADVMMGTGSQQVSWWSVHEYVAPLLDSVGSWPMLGSPEWCALPVDDDRKLAALLSAAEHHALRIETAQQADADASSDVSAAADWSALAWEIYQRNDFYTTHPWLRRVMS